MLLYKHQVCPSILSVSIDNTYQIRTNTNPARRIEFSFIEMGVILMYALQTNGPER